MEAANGSGSPNSKVIVRFTDPSDLFGDVAPLHANRLPLGNLHSKSPTRPLRSIEELDISLDREEPVSGDGAGSARRHQIPGLRQTPFVKVLLLRCDDKDKYKESVRKDAKDWVKSLGFSSSGKPTSKGQERHDAFEYLILHVVLPGTAAAVQPKSSKHISLEATESTDSVNSKSKWTGKSTSTVLDKIRADFASSSKAPFERVAQIRLNDSSKPSGVLSPLELEEQWQDLVDKLKTAILQSFDMRVAQYEEDIRERDAQRNLPGWNFCTFFILKEGLAKGFENVGLLEDALQIYEELDAGVDLLIQDQSRADSADTANALLPHSSDLKDIIRTVLEAPSTSNGATSNTVPLSLQGWSNTEAKRFPWKLERRDYQHMILTNQVSALDFRIYIFIRQMQLMLRRASISTPLPKSKQGRRSGPRWDADLLSDVCERSIKFMNLAARNLRQDLFAAWGGQDGLPVEELKTQKVAIDNIVASWKWASLLQILSESQIIASFTNLASRKGETPAGQLFSPTDIANSNTHGSETSISTVSSNDTASTDGSDKHAINDIFSNLRVVRGSKSDLIFWSAELFTMMRTIFVQLCRQSKLLPDVFRGSRVGGYVVEDPSIALAGVLSPSLRAMIKGEEAAFGAYKLLTVCACQCYTTAGKSRTSKQLLFDLAILEMHNQNHDAALGWLDAITGFLDTPPKTSIEQSMLQLYIECLRRTDRATVLIQSLMLEIRATSFSIRDSSHVQNLWYEIIAVAGSLDVLEFPFQSIFEIERIDEFISLDTGVDGCGITIAIRNTVSIAKFGAMKAELVSRSRSTSNPSQLTFSCQVHDFGEDSFALTARCSSSVEGWYDLLYLNLRFSNILFKLDLQPTASSEDEDTQLTSSLLEKRSVYMYPRNGSPALSISHAPLIDLSEKKHVRISLSAGSNDISSAQLHLKPATAGFRLDLLSAICSDDCDFSVDKTDDGQVLKLSFLPAERQISIEIPYSFEDVPAATASVKASLRYWSKKTEHDLFDNLSFMTLLPIGVNVQDIFLSNATFSRFTFAPSRLVPLIILDCGLEARNNAEISSASRWVQPVTAFPKQPASWVVSVKSEGKGKQKQLPLTVKYRSMDEAILENICSAFRGEIENSEFHFATRPLEAHLRNKTQTLWTEQEIELAVLTSEIELWSYEELGWSTLLPVFRKQIRIPLDQWLRQWHDRFSIISMRSEAAYERTLQLLVDVPTTDVLVTTEVELPTNIHCVIGQPVLVTLRSTAHVQTDASVEISVEMSNQSDLWLVGGQRKIILTNSEIASSTAIVLVAQKTGCLLLPAIDVKCRRTSSTTGHNEAIAFEVENLSIASTVTVTSQIQSTTLAIAQGEGSDSYWLIGSGAVNPR